MSRGFFPRVALRGCAGAARRKLADARRSATCWHDGIHSAGRYRATSSPKPRRGGGADSIARALLDAVTSRRAIACTTDGGHNPLCSTCAHVRAPPRVNALGPQGKCAGVSGEVLHGHRPRARTVGPEENGLSGQGHSRNARVRKDLELLARTENPVQKTYLA